MGDRVPFQTLDGEPLLAIELRQVGPNTFQLAEGFKYLDRTRGDREHVVPAHDRLDPRDSSDLASVPFILWWFIASYGHQTAPALLHDHLLKSSRDLGARREVDRVFRIALLDVEVGVFRSWIMWAAVSLQTIRAHRPLLFVVLVAQLLAGVAAIWVLPWFEPLGVDWWQWLLLPAVACVGWGRHLLVPLIATYVGAFLLPATLIVVATVVLSSSFRIVRWLVHRGRLPDGEGPIVAPYRVPGWRD